MWGALNQRLLVTLFLTSSVLKHELHDLRSASTARTSLQMADPKLSRSADSFQTARLGQMFMMQSLQEAFQRWSNVGHTRKAPPSSVVALA